MKIVKAAPVVLIIIFALTGAAFAEEVTIDHKGLKLGANLELAEGKTVRDGVILMTHGTLAHGGMEIMRTLQELFKESGRSTLAITLSLGVSGRQGMYDCKTPHRHRHSDALDEIGAWLGWLREKGAEKVTLLGHSRGGAQTAWFAAERDDAVIDRLILIAPMTWSQAGAEEDYEKRFGKELNPILHEARAMIKEGKGDSAIEHADFLYCKDATVSAETFVSYYSPEPRLDTPFLLERIAKPVMVFAGSQDTAVPDVAEKIRKRGLDKKVKLVEIDGADHFFRDIFAYDIVEAAGGGAGE